MYYGLIGPPIWHTSSYSEIAYRSISMLVSNTQTNKKSKMGTNGITSGAHPDSFLCVFASFLDNTSLTVSSSSSSSSRGGYVRSSRSKKPTAFQAKLSANPVCCDHDHEPVGPSNTSTNHKPEYPYMCIATVGPVLREREIRNTHESKTVFNDLNLHHFQIDQQMRDAIRHRQQHGAHEPSLPSHIRALVDRPLHPATFETSAHTDGEIIHAQVTDALSVTAASATSVATPPHTNE